jgi:hypothetical protein
MPLGKEQYGGDDNKSAEEYPKKDHDVMLPRRGMLALRNFVRCGLLGCVLNVHRAILMEKDSI